MSRLKKLWCAVVLATSLAGVTRVPAEPSESPEVVPVTEPMAEPVVETATNEAVASRIDRFNYLLSTARFGATTRDFIPAEANFVKLLADDVPEEFQRTALYELALMVQVQNQQTRAQSIFTQYVQRWPNDARIPDIYLHQGQIFREMGLNDLALTKFYAVMSAGLTLKNDQLPVYKRLVLQAKVEIAETHYLMGKYKDAADYYARLLKQNDPALDAAQIQFRLIRSLVGVKQFDEAATQAQDFLTRHAASAEAPEVRYDLAQSYKGLGRNAEALQQVLVFLKEEHAQTLEHPEVWT